MGVRYQRQLRGLCRGPDRWRLRGLPQREDLPSSGVRDTVALVVEQLDTGTDVEVYAKLPRSFFIPTPVGNYSPDWAIAFKQGSVKHIYFVAETKGSLSSMDLREIEKSKIACARKFFAKITSDQVKYDVIDSYAKLMELVK